LQHVSQTSDRIHCKHHPRIAFQDFYKAVIAMPGVAKLPFCSMPCKIMKNPAKYIILQGFPLARLLPCKTNFAKLSHPV
jgi:hypothetical protein